MQRGRKLCGLSSRRGKEDDERIEEERRVVEAWREKASSSSFFFFGICLQLGRDKLPRNERRTRGKKRNPCSIRFETIRSLASQFSLTPSPLFHTPILRRRSSNSKGRLQYFFVGFIFYPFSSSSFSAPFYARSLVLREILLPLKSPVMDVGREAYS